MINQSQQQTNTSSFALLHASGCIAGLTVFGAEAVVIVTLNALTIIVCLKERSLCKRSMYLVINQAVADMFVGASIASDFWLLGVSCDFWTIHHFSNTVYSVIFVLWFVFSSASFTNLAAISLERTHATFRPFKHRILKKKIFQAVVAAVWITAGLFPTIRALYEVQILSFERYKDFLISYYLFYLFCLLIMVVSYSSIVIKIVCGTQPHHHGATSKERKLTKTLFNVTVVSLLLTLPFIIFQTREIIAFPTSTMISPRTHFWFNYCLILVLYANSLVNPVLYTFRMPEFKRALCSALHCRSKPQSVAVFRLNEL